MDGEHREGCGEERALNKNVATCGEAVASYSEHLAKVCARDPHGVCDGQFQ